MESVTEWIFNAPWWLLVAAGGVSVGLLLWALGRQDKPVIRGALIAMVAVGLWTVLSLVIRTPQEKAADRVEAIVEAFDGEKWDHLGGLIEPETRFANWLKGPEITEAARQTKEQRGITSVSLRSLEVQRDDAGIRVIAHVRSEHATSLMPHLTTLWRFDFNHRGDEWRLEFIEPLPTERLDVPGILRQIERPGDSGRVGSRPDGRLDH